MVPLTTRETPGRLPLAGLLQVRPMDSNVESGDTPCEGARNARSDCSGRSIHEPVLLAETLELLDVRPDGTYVDATVGTAGHARAVLERLGPKGRLIGLDRDGEVLPLAHRRLQAVETEGRFELHHAEFATLGDLLSRCGVEFVDGILADLGMSSWQLDWAERGFSHALDGPLDMRLDRSQTTTASDLVNRLPERELARLLHRYGEEPRSRLVARALVRRRRDRRISRTAELTEIVRSVVSVPEQGDVLARTFQALRIAVNRELESLQAFLAQAPRCLARDGRLVVTSFHSLEDRLVKQAMVRGQRAGVFELLTRKPIQPGPEEVARNPRSRSARLRAGRKLLATGSSVPGGR